MSILINVIDFLSSQWKRKFKDMLQMLSW